MKHLILFEKFLSNVEVKTVASHLKELSPKMLDPQSFGEYIEDYSRNPEDYNIDIHSHFYKAVEDAWNEISVKPVHKKGAVPQNYTSWDIDTIENSNIYQAYCKLFR